MITPQLAKEATLTSLEHYINSDEWVMEQKLDGHRLLLCSPGGDFPPTALTRSGSPYTRKLSRGLSEFRFPDGNGPHDFLLDGELVGETVNGHTVSSTFWVFDLPFAKGIVGEGVHLWERRLFLEQFMDIWAEGNPAIRLAPQARTREEKIALAEKALADNFEGLILKRKDAPYRSGMRTEEWLKVKFKKTVDVIVIDVRDDGKDSVRLGIIRDGQIIDVGRASLIGKEKGGTFQRGDVLEVMYLYCNNPEKPRLYQPTVMRKRDPSEKPMHECTDDQLQYTDKSVLPSL